MITMQTYYVIYGVDVFDDYMKLLSEEEFNIVSNALNKFIDKDCELCDLVTQYNVRNITNNILYYLPVLLEKREVKTDEKVYLNENISLKNIEEDSEKIINSIIDNAGLIGKVDIKFLGNFKVSKSTVYIYRLRIAD
ncbi:hypothetical protein [Thermococcus sp. JCM 11816]|uniref:hypothetical protein n=1 Tax=Thermococcus sp. (strain JCM 11816 / KS-1) TaxID=1295125 RepID=UPI0034659915